MEAIIKDFGVNPFFLVAQAVNFAVLLLILKKFLYKPILKVLDERKQRIAQGLKNAEEIEKRLSQIEQDREKHLERARTEAKKVIEEASKNAEKIILQAHEKASLDVAVMFKKGEASLKLEKEKLHQEIRSELGNLVVLAMEKVVRRWVGPKDQKQMVQEAIKDL